MWRRAIRLWENGERNNSRNRQFGRVLFWDWRLRRGWSLILGGDRDWHGGIIVSRAPNVWLPSNLLPLAIIVPDDKHQR